MSHKPYPEVDIICSKDFDIFYASEPGPAFEGDFLKVVAEHDQDRVVVSCCEEGSYHTSYITIEQTKALIDFLQKVVDKKSGDGK